MNNIFKDVFSIEKTDIQYIPLCEATELTAGARITKAMMDDDYSYIVMGGGVSPSGKYKDYNFEHAIAISRAGSAGFVNWIEGKFWATDVCFVCSEKRKDINIKYIYHYLKMKQPELQTKIYGGNLPKLDKNYLWDLLIPIPNIEIQNKIVELLDVFINLDGELENELALRKKIFEETQEILISRTEYENADKCLLSDIFDFRNGLSKGKEFFGRGIPFVRYTDVYNNRFLHEDDLSELVECTETEKSRLKVSRGDVFFTRTSETQEDIGWSSVMLDDIENCVFNGFTIKATPKIDVLLPEYCAYCFSVQDFRKYVASHCSFTTRASLTGNTIGEYEITVPSKEIQEKIVKVLDMMYTICFDKKMGIPAELAAREKQYIYYSKLLMEFEGGE